MKKGHIVLKTVQGIEHVLIVAERKATIAVFAITCLGNRLLSKLLRDKLQKPKILALVRTLTVPWLPQAVRL